MSVLHAIPLSELILSARRTQWISSVLGLCLLGYLFLYNTYLGLNVQPDSLGFLQQGELFAPLYTHFLQQFDGSFQARVEQAKLWHLLCYLSSAALLYALARTAGAPHAVGLALGLAFGINEHILSLYSMVHNEALAFTVLLGALLVQLRFMQTQDWRWLLALGLLMGMLPALRYATVTLLLGSGIMLLCQNHLSYRQRLANVLALGAVASAVGLSLLLGFERIALTEAEVGGRETAFNGTAGLKEYLYGIESLGNVWLPKLVHAYLSSLLVLLALLSLAWVAYQSTKTLQQGSVEAISQRQFGRGMLGQALLHLAFLLFMIQVEAFLTLDTRYMVLVVMLLLLSIATAIHWPSLEQHRHRRLWHLVLLTCLLYYPLNVARTVFQAQINHQQGLGYNSLVWQHSSTMQALTLQRDPEPGYLLVSNGPEVLEYWLNRPAQFIPEYFFRRTGEDFEQPYAVRKQAVIEQLQTQGGYYVHFDRITHRDFYLPSLKDVQREYPFTEVLKTADGALYAHSQGPNVR